MNLTTEFNNNSIFNPTLSPSSLFDNITEDTDQFFTNNITSNRGGSPFYRFSLSPMKVFLRYSPIMSVCLLGVLLNSFAVTLLVKLTRNSKISTNIILTSQLVFDLGASLSAVFMALGEAFKPTRFSGSIAMHIACRVWYSRFIVLTFTNMSILNCTLLTLERYLKIVFPLRYKIHVTKKVAKAAVAGTYIFNILNSAFMFLITMTVTDGQCERDESTFSETFYHVTRIYNNIIMTGIPLGCIFVCYTHMLIVLHKRSKQFGKVNKPTNRQVPGLAIDTPSQSMSSLPTTEISSVDKISQSDKPTSITIPSVSEKTKEAERDRKRIRKPRKDENILLKAERNLLKVAIFVSICFIACNAPVRLYYLLSVFGLYETSHGTVYMVCATLVYLNFALHPVVYALTLKPLREKLTGLFRRLRH